MAEGHSFLSLYIQMSLFVSRFFRSQENPRTKVVILAGYIEIWYLQTYYNHTFLLFKKKDIPLLSWKSQDNSNTLAFEHPLEAKIMRIFDTSLYFPFLSIPGDGSGACLTVRQCNAHGGGYTCTSTGKESGCQFLPSKHQCL